MSNVRTVTDGLVVSGEVIEAKLSVAEMIERVKHIGGKAATHADMGGSPSPVWVELQAQLGVLSTAVWQAQQQVNRNVG